MFINTILKYQNTKVCQNVKMYGMNVHIYMLCIRYTKCIHVYNALMPIYVCVCLCLSVCMCRCMWRVYVYMYICVYMYIIYIERDRERKREKERERYEICSKLTIKCRSDNFTVNFAYSTLFSSISSISRGMK